MRHWPLFIAALAIALTSLGLPEIARTQQSDDAETQDTSALSMDDPGFIERQIQNLLGGDGRTVRIAGLEGVLSSELRIGRIEVADDDGTWLAIDNVAMNWRRLALLRRRFEVESLTIGEIDLTRRPVPPPAEAPALAADEEAQPFSLPQLPVAINVGELSIDQIRLGQPVLGQSVDMRATGSASLRDGMGRVALDIQRTDARQGNITLDAGFEDETRNLDVDLDVREEAGGLIATLSRMPGAPSLELQITGDAPMSDFTADIRLASDDVERLTGFVRLEEETTPSGPDRTVEVKIDGDVAELFLPDYRTFFGRDVSLDVVARMEAGAGTRIETLDLRTQALTLNGSLALSETGWPDAIDLQGRIGTENGLPVILPLPGPQVAINSAALSVTHDQTDSETIEANITADGVSRADGLLVDTVDVTATGQLAHGSDGTGGGFSGYLTSRIDGLSFTNEALWDAVGDTITLDTTIDWTQNGPLSLSDLQAASGDLSLSGDATIDGLQDGTITADVKVMAEAEDLSRFSKISRQNLSGAISADVTADYDAVSGAFDVTLDGTTQDIAIGTAGADDLLAGRTNIGVTAQRNAQGISLERLEIDGARIDLDGTAALASDGWPDRVNLSGTIGASDGSPVALPLPGQSMTLGSARIAFEYDANQGDGYSADVSVTELAQGDQAALAQADISAEGTLTRAGVRASVEEATSQLQASYSGFSLPQDPALSEAAGPAGTLAADARWVAGGALTLDKLAVASGDLSLSGNGSVTGLGTAEPLSAAINGEFSTGSIARFAQMSGQQMSGEASGTVDGSLDLANYFFDVTLDAEAQDLAIGPNTSDSLLDGRTEIGITAARDASGIDLSRLEVKGNAIDLGGTAKVEPDFWPHNVDIAGRIGRPDGAAIALPGVDISLDRADLDLTYDTTQSDAFRVSLSANNVVSGAQISLLEGQLQSTGRLEREDGARSVSRIVADLSASLDGVSSRTNNALAEALGSQSDVTASLDWDLDGALDLSHLSVSSGDLTLMAKAVVDGLRNGDLKVDGSGDLTAGSLSRFAALSGQSLSGNVTASVNGTFEESDRKFAITLDGRARDLAVGIPAADAVMAGETTLSVQADGDGDDVTLTTFDLRNPELTASASGKMTGGDGAFSLTARLRDLQRIAPQFAGPLNVNATATGNGGTWSVDSALEGPASARADVKGIVLQPSGDLDLTATGALPLPLIDRLITPRSVLGTANFDLAVRGKPGLDAVSGNISVEGARFADPATRLALEDTDVTVTLANSQATLDVASNLSTGGRITASGPIGLTPPFQGDITVDLDALTLEDPRLYKIDLGGNISMVGPLTGGAEISGRIDVARAELKIPSTFASSGTVLDVVHIDEPRSSLITRERAGVVAPDDGEQSSGGGRGGGPAYPLNVVISAPNEIFIRGRGLDAELGGRVDIQGTTAAPSPTGGFRLIRGRLNILSRRLEFSQAEVTLQGDLVPYIYMVASSQADGITANIVIEGPVNDPEIMFTSNPELPEDEVLAQLFFGKPINELTPLEAAQLVAAINTLRGGGGTGILGRLRQRLGLDNIDVQSDEEGNTEVTAGKYLTERIYTDVSVDSDNTTRIELNYDLTPSLKARGSYRTDGNTGIGFTFERDY